MNILVTGATGFIGVNLCAKLVEKSRVYALVRSGSASERLPGGVECISESGYADLSDLMLSLRIEGVIHLASCFIAEHVPEDIERLIGSNLTYGTRVLDAAIRAKVKWFINTSSFWQHFNNVEGSPANLYASTKQAFECILDYYRNAFPIRIASLELVDTYGRNDPRRKLIAILLDAMLNQRPLALSPGEQLMNLVYIEDAVAAYELLIARISDPNAELLPKYAIHAEYLPSVRDLVRLMEGVVGMPLEAQWGGRPYRMREYMAPEQIHPVLPGWKSQTTLEQGLKKLLEKYPEASS